MTGAMTARTTTAPETTTDKRDCACGEEHSADWWEGYDAGREDGYEQGVEDTW